MQTLTLLHTTLLHRKGRCCARREGAMSPKPVALLSSCW